MKIVFRGKDGNTTTNIDEAKNFSRLSDDLYVENHFVEQPRIVLEQRLSFADGVLIGGMVVAVIATLLIFIFM